MYHKYTYLNFKSICFLTIIFLFIQTGQSKAFVKSPKGDKHSAISGTLVDIFSQLSKQTSYKFSYSEAIISDQKKYTVAYSSPLKVILENLADKAGFDYSIVNNLVLVSKKSKIKTASKLASQQEIIKGKVLDENGDPLPGATVKEIGTKNGVTTDAGGKFEIKIVRGKTLEISFIGYKNKQIVVNSDMLNIQLESDASSLGEVLVVGYGKQTKKDVTGSVLNWMKRISGKV